jgi:Cdc6-like AAA superfamily ATPase
MTTNIVQPLDLEMQVRLTNEHGRTRLSFILHSPSHAAPFHHLSVAGPILQGSPEELQSRLLQRLLKFNQGRDVDDSLLLQEDIQRRLAGMGQQLWRELFPPEMQQAYRKFREIVRTWMIVSDEQWIPWELIKPYDDSHPQEIIDDDFVCLRFQLTRWIPGASSPAEDLPIFVLACIYSKPEKSPPLPNAELEKNLVSSIAMQHPGTLDASGTTDSLEDAIKVLDQGVDLIHFVAHSQTVPEPGLFFQDGSVLRPMDLSGPLQTRIASRRPFVFMNTDSAIPSWAHHWISRLKAGAFISPLWPVRDSRLFEFSKILYESLSASETFGVACLKARRHLQTVNPADLSFLAYRLYAHPNGRFRFVEETSEMSTEAGTPQSSDDQTILAHSVGQLSGAASDRVAIEDRLGFHLYIESFADLIESPYTQLPLTVGIFGSWGMGKSFLLEHVARRIKERQGSRKKQRTGRFSAVTRLTKKLRLQRERASFVHTISFNAWEYSASEAIWPGLVRKVMNRLEREVRWPWPGRFLIKLGWNARQLFQEERGRILVISYLAAAAVVAVIVHLGSGESLRNIWAALLAVGALGGILKLVSDTLANPVSQWITNLFQGKDYGRHIGQFARIRGDLEFLERQLRKADGRILVLIDDLDRCEPDKAVEMLQAIKLLLDFETFIIFLGIDARIVTRAVERHYRGILGDAGASGYEYLDKIVQIPFRIPTPEGAEVEVFLSDLMGNPFPSFSRVATASTTSTEPDFPISPDARTATPVRQNEERPLLASNPGNGEELRSFSYEELQAFRNLTPFLKPNPRHLKRLVNIYRLIRALAIRSGSILQQKPGPTICWVILCAQWPYTAYLMLSCFEDLMREANDESLKTQNPLPYLLTMTDKRIDLLQQKMLDHDPALLFRLVNEAVEARMSWDDLRLIRRYTINFNPAIEFEEFVNIIKAPTKPADAPH